MKYKKSILLVCLLLCIFSCTQVVNDAFKADYLLRPDYNSSLNKVMISLSLDDKSLEIHHSLLSALPEYTQILLLMPRDNLLIIQEQLAVQPYEARVKIIPFVTTLKQEIYYYFLFPEKQKLQNYSFEEGHIYPHGSIWAQDLFLTAQKKESGQFILLVPQVYKWFFSFTENPGADVLLSDNLFINKLTACDFEIQRIPLVFSGGNILIDEVDGKKMAFCGSDVVKKTRIVLQGLNSKQSTDSNHIIELIKKYLNVDQVELIAQDKKQPRLMFHLDQAVILLADRVAGVINIVEQHHDHKYLTSEQDLIELQEVKSFIAALKACLEKYNYQIFDVDISIDNLFNHQFYTNAIPYVHAQTGKKTILLPVFQEDTIDKKLELDNTSRLQAHGYEVVHVSDTAYSINGGIHCLINVIE